MNKEGLYNLVEWFLELPKETEIVEFKVNNDQPSLIGEYISALANSACLHEQKFGYLVYGINDDQEVVGTAFKPSATKHKQQELESWLSIKLSPKTDFEFFEFDYNGFELAIIKIDAAISRPISFDGTAYIRVGSYKNNLSHYPDKERKIWTKTNNQPFEELEALGSLNEDEVLKLLDYPSYFSLLNVSLPTDKYGILKKFEEEKLIEKVGKSYNVTNLGAILFAKDLTNFPKLIRKAIRVIIYKGKNRLHTVKEQADGKGYALGFEGLISYINDQLPTNEEIGAAFRKEVKMYPELAIREAVANALIHQDFHERGTGPMIEIFSDRIEISNPGKPLMSTLRLIDHRPQSRNEQLAYFMRRLNICEERGSGIDKIVNLAEEYQLPAPKFTENENAMQVTLYAYKNLNDMNRDDKIRACYQHCCLKHISSENMTNQSLRERLNVRQQNYSIVSRIINDTIGEGLIKPYDPDSNSKRHAKYVPFWG
ncbi:transcriptional regulator [Planococcus kocurii]|uniref:Transcriptional regulator n=1 Tax=Planococcus kocurii TaxID=1374 RepID=A0ABM5WSF9_9BACL|nr:ATP-binding protein [Planococcus kocurii]ALS77214.1 transcriptional regulator [Planococcus kocurii]